MNVALFKIWRTGLPNLCFRMECFYGTPCTIPKAFTVLVRVNKEQIKAVMVCLFIKHQNNAANFPSLKHDKVVFTAFRINGVFNRFARNDLPITVKMSVTHSKFYHCPVFERPLVIPDELFTILPLRLKAARGSLFLPEVIDTNHC